MPLRVGFDLDGTLADFAAAFHEMETRVLGPGVALRPGEPEAEAAVDVPEGGPLSAASREAVRHQRCRTDLVWAAIRETPNFWETLAPIDPGAVQRVHDLMLRHGWEVFFITQRPRTAGDTVQRQTQRWLAAHGFDLPSVLALGGPRGAVVAALRLDYHVDDTPQNCMDIVADSQAKPLLIVAGDDAGPVAAARTLGIGTVSSIAAALDVLDQASAARSEPGILARLAGLVGWR